MRPIPLAVLLVFASGGAFASSCSEEIATLGKRLDSTGARQVTGEAKAGARRAGSEKALAEPPAGRPSDPASTPSAAGVEEARALLRKATVQEAAGDAEGCRNTVMKAKQAAGAMP